MTELQVPADSGRLATVWAEVADQLLIERLLARQGRCLDEGDFDGLRALFTSDATVTTPGGTATGQDALVAQARNRHAPEDAIQHVITNVLTEVAGDAASVRANVVVTFARGGLDDPAPWGLGTVNRYRLQWVEDGWRIAALTSTPVWSQNRRAS
jgi:3-phenylpropionate/cinnamic acid dioxygenase small subunit